MKGDELGTSSVIRSARLGGGGGIPRRSEYLLLTLVVLGYLLLQIIAAPAVHMTNDSYRYGRSALQILGFSRGEAQAHALAAFCADHRAAVDRFREVNTIQFRQPLPADYTATCISKMPHGLTPNSPRYEAIFDSRPGYPLLAAPFTDLLGINHGLYFTSALLTALGGFLVYVLLRSVGLMWSVAILGQVLYYVTPIGMWGSYPLTEGAATTLTVSALLGAWWMTRRRVLLGAIVLVTALVMGFFVRYSSFLMVSIALILAGLIILWRSCLARRRATLAMIALNMGWLAAAILGSRLLHWPGMRATLQDTFTDHFQNPDVSDPWGRLAEMNGNYWSQWLQVQMHAPWLLLLLGVSIWALVRSDTTLATVVTLVAFTGITTVVSHPVVGQDERLMVALWLVPVIGMPTLVSAFIPCAMPERAL